MIEKKIKTLVVEDEVLLLKNIEKKIQQADPDFQIVGSAYDGEEALKLVEQERPDVVFTDIRMPIMDGLRLTELLKEAYPSVLVVIVSGYDDFQYARRALGYGVCDYLLKPVRPEELKKTLEKLKERVLAHSGQRLITVIQAQIRQNMPVELDEDLRQYLAEKPFGMFLVCTGNLRMRVRQQDEAKKDLWEQILKDMDPEGTEFYVFPENPGLCLLLLRGGGDKRTTAEKLLQKAQEQEAGASVSIAYMTEDIIWQQLHGAFRKARQILLSNVRIGHSGIFSDNKGQKETVPAVLSAVMTNQLQTLINGGNVSGLHKTILQLLKEWNQEGYSQQWVEKVLHQILLLFQQNLFFSEEDYDRMFQNVFETLEIESASQDWEEKIAEELCGWMRQNRQVPSEIEEAIQQMETYIRKHYTEQINLSELAETYHFNHSYMTRLFKKMKGQTPIKLINSLRMADAKEMLKKEELSIREISETLGFTDQHYFSRTFKEATGVTPKEYRMLEK